LYDNNIIKNKYGIELSKSLLCRYYDDLIGNFYKILPIFEQSTHEQYKKYVGNFIHEICGGYYLFDENTYFLKLLTNLESMLSIKETEHDDLKSLVFGCINILNKLKGEVLNGV
jgi:hypothetical protein